MYRTSAGLRVLEGNERAFFTASFGMMVDLLSDHDFEFGLPAFDQMQRGQKLFAMYEAGRALLRPDQPAPELTAYLEATVATVYQFAYDQIVTETDDPDFSDEPHYWRGLALRAVSELDADCEFPEVNCDERSRWKSVVELLEGKVLWDRDFEMQFVLDLDPQHAEKVKGSLRIETDFFTAVPIEVPDCQFNLYLDALMGLTPQGRW